MLIVFTAADYSGRDMDIRLKAVLILSQTVFFLYYYKMSVKNFGGITGDQAGYFLCISELVYAAVVCLGGYLWY